MQIILTKTRTFLEMIKVEHSIFALPFAYLGLIFALQGWPSAALFWKVTAAMVFFRSAAMGLNRLIDAKIDGMNPRTMQRAIPAGKLKASFVWTASIVCLALFEWTVYYLNPVCFKLTPVPILLTFLYPWTKRFTWFSHFVLGIILGIAPYGTWLCAGRSFSWVPGFLMIGVAAWVAGFDIIYALQDLEFDQKVGLYSLPARFGVEASLRIAAILHALTAGAWIAAGYWGGFGFIYQAGMVLIVLFLAREHWLVRSHGLEKINEAFFSMNAMISICVFAAAAADLAFRRLA